MGQRIAPRPDGDIGFLATDRDVVVRRVGDAKQQVVQLAFDLGERGVERPDPFAGHRGGRAKVGDFEAIRCSPVPDRLADLLRRTVPFRLECLAFGEQSAPLGIEPEGAVDEQRVLALADRALTDAFGIFAKSLESDAHRSSPEAECRRSMTNAGSRLARSQPARGPFVRPRKAR